jgi:hypothetical protein
MSELPVVCVPLVQCDSSVEFKSAVCCVWKNVETTKQTRRTKAKYGGSWNVVKKKAKKTTMHQRQEKKETIVG